MTNVDYALIYINYLLEKIFIGISPIHVIERRSKTGAISRISPEVQNGIYSIDHIKHLGEYSELVAEFKKIFDEKLSHYNNTALYDRLENIKIVEELIEREKSDGQYDNEKNIVIIDKDKINKHSYPAQRRRTVLFHELVHMATTYTKGIVTMVGFNQKVANKYSKGRGLNEGYTELITQRYFARTIANEKGTNISYPREQLIAYGIELLVGKEKMEELFFDGDLDGLLTEMSKYMPLQEANMLLGMADYFEEKKENRNLVEAAAKSIIANRIISKQKALYQSGEITKEEYEFKLLEVEMYTRGYYFRKSKNGYELEPIFMEDIKRISNEGYRVLQNKFKSTKNYDTLYTEEVMEENQKTKLISTAFHIFLAEQDDKVDMSQVETLEVIDPVTHQYKITPRMTSVMNEHSEELSSMFQDDSPPKAASSKPTNVNK